MKHTARAFTIGQLLVLIVFGVIVLGCTGILAGSIFNARAASQQLNDSRQVRGLIQAMVLFAQNNSDQLQYPLPSALDPDNTIVSEINTAKDTSANIYSILLYNGLVTTEALISPREKGHIRRYADYELSAPQAAINPGEALWDPAFRADFTAKKPGGVSYAHMLPGGTRKEQWANTFKSEQVIVANRGPHVDSVSYDENGRISTIAADPDSKATRMHGRTRWAGNVGYNDNHVKFEQYMHTIFYTDTLGQDRSDVLFYDEPDDPTHTNAFLSLFTTAGDTNADFTAIWD